MNKSEKTALVPKLRFPEFIVNGAICFESGDIIFEPISNKNHDSDLPVLAITQEHGAIPRDQIDYNVSVTDKSLKSYKVVEIGDFIISLRSFQGGIEYSLYNGICSPAYIILRNRIPIVDQYYKHYFKTGKFIQDLNKDLEGIRDGKMVSYSQFSAIMLPKPDREEQQKVADCLSSLDDLIAAEDKKLETLKAHKKGLMQKLFSQEIRLKDNNGLDYPEWDKKQLNDICCSISSGKSKKSTDENGFPLYGSTGLIGKTDIADYDGDFLLVARVGANAGHIYTIHGKCGITDNTLVIDVNREKVVLNYLNYFLCDFNLNKLIFGSGQPLITGNQLKTISLELPSLSEQQRIADCLSSFDELIAAQIDKNTLLKTYKKGLMQGLFPSIEEVGV